MEHFLAFLMFQNSTWKLASSSLQSCTFLENNNPPKSAWSAPIDWSFLSLYYTLLLVNTKLAEIFRKRQILLRLFWMLSIAWVKVFHQSGSIVLYANKCKILCGDYKVISCWYLHNNMRGRAKIQTHSDSLTKDCPIFLESSAALFVS